MFVNKERIWLFWYLPFSTFTPHTLRPLVFLLDDFSEIRWEKVQL